MEKKEKKKEKRNQAVQKEWLHHKTEHLNADVVDVCILRNSDNLKVFTGKRVFRSVNNSRTAERGKKHPKAYSVTSRGNKIDVKDIDALLHFHPPAFL